jgi:hypothetical protein
MSFGQRLVVLALIFAAPTVLSPALFAQPSWKEIPFVEREWSGAAYLDAVRPLFEAQASGRQPLTAQSKAAVRLIERFKLGDALALWPAPTAHIDTREAF